MKKSFLDQYQEASANMGNDVVEYIRGISVVKSSDKQLFLLNLSIKL